MCKHILINNFNAETDLDTIASFASRTHERDGYGYIIRTSGGDIETGKSLSEGDFYLSLCRRLLSGDVSTLVVHHRTSTNKAGLDYAHPFEFQGQYLTHNGVVSVPGKHATKTKNDSEELLHHLVKTGWETKSIQGYFSCFILTKKKTRIIVDDTAPMHSDGRIYSSHRLSDSFKPVKLRHVVLSADGKTLSDSAIEVTKTSYGKEKAHLSLGGSYWPAEIDYYHDKQSVGRHDQADDPATAFLELASDYVLEDLWNNSRTTKFYDKLADYADHYGIMLDHADAEELREYLAS